ncbi:host attachment protein [Dyella halodurans]|uniref:Host attachment protein n=1 Tax=Dyella halodurans TaxID=1920171 RepID=A0ABV9C270_9GAMM|nr:host attachment protein [Dyella halodurans]
MSNAWILVSDAAKARLFEMARPSHALVEIACFTNLDGRNTNRNGLGHRLPRSKDSLGPTRHANAPHRTWREKHAHQFAKSLKKALINGQVHHQFERLFLVAPPRFLGVLHESLDDHLAAQVAGEIGNDLIALRPSDLLDRLHVAFPHDFRAQPAHAAA